MGTFELVGIFGPRIRFFDRLTSLELIHKFVRAVQRKPVHCPGMSWNHCRIHWSRWESSRSYVDFSLPVPFPSSLPRSVSLLSQSFLFLLVAAEIGLKPHPASLSLSLSAAAERSDIEKRAKRTFGMTFAFSWKLFFLASTANVWLRFSMESGEGCEVELFGL